MPLLFKWIIFGQKRDKEKHSNQCQQCVELDKMNSCHGLYGINLVSVLQYRGCFGDPSWLICKHFASGNKSVNNASIPDSFTTGNEPQANTTSLQWPTTSFIYIWFRSLFTESEVSSNAGSVETIGNTLIITIPPYPLCFATRPTLRMVGSASISLAVDGFNPMKATSGKSRFQILHSAYRYFRSSENSAPLSLVTISRIISVSIAIMA